MMRCSSPLLFHACSKGLKQRTVMLRIGCTANSTWHYLAAPKPATADRHWLLSILQLSCKNSHLAALDSTVAQSVACSLMPAHGTCCCPPPLCFLQGACSLLHSAPSPHLSVTAACPPAVARLHLCASCEGACVGPRPRWRCAAPHMHTAACIATIACCRPRPTAD